MKKLSQQTRRANDKKSRKGSRKRKKKTARPVQTSKPVVSPTVKRRDTLDGNRFLSCLQPNGTLDHDAALLDSIGLKYGIKNLSSFRMSDYEASADTREMFYRIEALFCEQDMETGEEWGMDSVYDFQKNEHVQDRRYSETLMSFRPYEYPEVYSTLQRAKEVFNEIMLMRRGDWIPISATGDYLRMKGCWIVGCDNDSPIQTFEEEWVANEDDSYETLKDRRLMYLMLKASGALENLE